MDTKHTPGPWYADIETFKDGGQEHFVHVDGEKICALSDLLQSEANARLIAAAPDMLALLELIESAGDDQFNAMDLKFALDHLRNIKALCAHEIAKARGHS